jgi:endoglucanase
MSLQHRLAVIVWILVGVSSAAAQSAAPAASHNTPAYQTSLKLMRGVNFGNYLEYKPGEPAANATYTAHDFDLARSEGFDHVRLPVGWWIYCGPGPDFTITNAIFSKADFMVTNALNNGLAIIVDLHNFYDFYANPTGFTNEFHAIWRQVAAHYAAAPSNVAFELLNEPFNVATTALMNGVYAEAIRQIRQTNPNRTIIVGPGNYNSLDEVSNLVLPANDQNLMVAVHCYDPYYFTHQGAEWAYPDTKTTGVLYPGPPPVPLQPDPSITHDWVLTWFRQYNTYPTYSNPSSAASFKTRMKNAKAWADAHHRPLVVGEFGCYSKADSQSRVAFYQSIRETMDALGMGWTMWDWKSGFHYIVNGVPEPADMRAAMFPAIELVPAGKGAFTVQAAVGKTFVVEKTSSLLPMAWQTVTTQTLSSPLFSFTDTDTSETGSYYRVRWLK